MEPDSYLSFGLDEAHGQRTVLDSVHSYITLDKFTWNVVDTPVF